MNEYELVVLLHPDLEIDLDKPLKKVEAAIKLYKGKIKSSDVWGKRKLAYRVSGEDFAVYVYFEVELPAESVSKFEKAMNISDEVLRYLLTYPVPKSERDLRHNKEEETPQDSGSKEEE